MEEKEERDSSEDKIKITEEEIEQGDKIRITEEEVSEDKIKITEEEVGGEEKIRITGEEVINRGGKTPISDSYNLNQGQQGYGKYIPARRNTNKMAFILIPAIIIIIAIGAFLIPKFISLPHGRNVSHRKINIDKTISELEREVKNNPENIEKREKLSALYILNNDIEKSYEEFNNILKLNADDDYAKGMIELLKIIREVD